MSIFFNSAEQRWKTSSLFFAWTILEIQTSRKLYTQPVNVSLWCMLSLNKNSSSVYKCSSVLSVLRPVKYFVSYTYKTLTPCTVQCVQIIFDTLKYFVTSWLRSVYAYKLLKMHVTAVLSYLMFYMWLNVCIIFQLCPIYVILSFSKFRIWQ
jgi:hypothetical protein